MPVINLLGASFLARDGNKLELRVQILSHESLSLFFESCDLILLVKEHTGREGNLVPTFLFTSWNQIWCASIHNLLYTDIKTT